MLSYSAIGAGLGISKQAVSKLVAKGMPKDSVEEAREWRRRNLNPGLSKQPDEPPPSMAPSTTVDAPEDDEAADFFFERARKERAAADKLEIEVAMLRGTLLPATTVRAEFAKTLSGIRDSILQVPSRLGPILAGTDDPRRIETILDTELRAVIGGHVTP